MEKSTQLCDACIVCALPEEAKAFLEEVKQECNITFEELIGGEQGRQYDYRLARIKNRGDESLTLHVSWLPSYGPQEMTLHLSYIVEECQPRIVVMTGICAGDPQQVQLGDLVVADRTYTYDNGRFTRDEQGRSVHQHDITTYQLNANLLQYLRLFDAWESLVVGLERPSLPSHQFSRSQVRCHIKPIASCNAVRADNPFQDVQVPVYKTAAIDMEGAALGLVMSRYPDIPWLVVKGVCDYADSKKDDSYHGFAASASALYALSFIQTYVTNERLAPKPLTKPFISRNIPYRRNRYFTGREALLQKLHKELNSSKRVGVTYVPEPQAISGMGGIGKTQTAIEYAYRYSYDRDDYETVFWVQAEKIENIISGFKDIAEKLNLPEKNANPELIVEKVKEWLGAHAKSLLILDNAVLDNTDDLSMVQKFLPPASSHSAHTLLTTRSYAVEEIAKRVVIDIMNEEEGIQLLLKRAGLPQLITDEDWNNAREIVKELGGLPLALAQAGAYIEEAQCSFSDYLELYRERRAELHKENKPLDYNYTVATTWSVSFERVKVANPAATELLYLCAFLAPDAIPEEIIVGGTQVLGPVLGSLSSDKLRMNEIFRALSRFSLVQRNTQDNTLSIHRLVQAVIQDNMGKEARHIWADRAIRTVHYAFPKRVNDVKTWDQCRRCLPHALLCAELLDKYKFTYIEAAQLLNQVGYYLREQARYKDAEKYFHQALAISEQWGPEHVLDKVQFLNNLARLYFDQYRYTEAEPFYEQALVIRKQRLTPNDRVVLQASNSLALNYWYEGKHAEAEALYEHILPISKQGLGPEDDQTLFILNNQALLYRSQGKYEEAIKQNQLVLEVRKRKFGPTQSEVVQFLQNSKETYYPDHLEVAQSLQNLGVTYYYEQLEQEQADQSKYEEAEHLLKRALAIREVLLPKNHLQISRCLNYLALVYQVQKKYKEAAQPFKRALDIIEEHLGKEIPEAISIAKNYHELLQKLMPELSRDFATLEMHYKNLSHVNLDEDLSSRG